MSWFDNAVNTVTSTAQGIGTGISNGVTSATNSVSNWLGSGPNTADAATARGGDGLNNDRPDSWWGRVGQTVGDFGRGVQQEGIGGLLDGGMMDRQLAQRQLSDRFQVVGDDHVGPRASNQVSQEEYQRIAHQFSDIRRGESDLRIDGSRFSPLAGNDRAAWEGGVQANIADMMMTTSGRQQIDNLSNNVVRNDDGSSRRHLWGFGPEQHHTTTIAPLFGQQTPDANGSLEWTDPGFWGRDASTLRNDNAFAQAGNGSWDDFYAGSRDVNGNRGAGVNSTIQFNPGHVLGLRSDVVLAHEMEHSLHQTQGTMGFGDYATGNDSGIGNRERQAVGLTRGDSPTGGHYPGDPDGCTENTYRQQRNALGDRFLPRTEYSGLPGEAPATMSDADLQARWSTHNSGPDVPR